MIHFLKCHGGWLSAAFLIQPIRYLCVLILLVSGCPTPVGSLTLQQCAEACGALGVESVTSVECTCQTRVEAPTKVPFDPVGC